MRDEGLLALSLSLALRLRLTGTLREIRAIRGTTSKTGADCLEIIQIFYIFASR